MWGDAAERHEAGSQQAVCRFAREHQAAHQVCGHCMHVPVLSRPTANQHLICRKYREWQCGVGLFAIGNVLNFVSFGMLLAMRLQQQYQGFQVCVRTESRSLRAGFAAQSLLAALGSIQFVSNVIFAWFVLHERVRVYAGHCQCSCLCHTTCVTCTGMYHVQADRRVIIATAMIVVGCIVLVVFGNHQSAPLTTQELLRLFKKCV